MKAYLSTITSEAKILATNQMVIQAISDLGAAYQVLGDDATTRLQSLYVQAPQNSDSRLALDNAGDGSTYSQTHGRYHPWFRQVLKERGYYDIFLVNSQGQVVYSVFKETDFATNLSTGPWKDTDLARVFEAARSKTSGGIAFTDFAPYAPSNQAPASFIATPVHGPAGTFHGALIFQMPIERMNAILTQIDGMGETGESYIVGQDQLMRSQSRLASEPTILKYRIATLPVQKALAGDTGVMMADDYHGSEVLSAYGSLDYHGVTWAIIAEMNVDEANAPIHKVQWLVSLSACFIVVSVGIIGLVLARRITTPLSAMTAVMAQLAHHNLSVAVPYARHRNEIGDMAKSVKHFKDQMLRVQQLEKEQEEQNQHAQDQRRKDLNRFADSFEQSVGDIIHNVTSASTELQTASAQMSATAQDTTHQAGTVAQSASQASANVSTVASATEELNSSIAEIGQHVHRSTEVATQAVTSAKTTTQTVQSLEGQVTKIGEIVDLINDISDQTNLLALNATIEAARAGDAGKGFAVVASEVKHLATQTGRATQDIADQIGQIQKGTKDAVFAIGHISKIITEMHEISSAIAIAVEEQNAATSEIARNIDEASTGTQTVTENIANVEKTAQETGLAAGQIEDSAETLSEQAHILKAEMEAFLNRVRNDQLEQA